MLHAVSDLRFGKCMANIAATMTRRRASRANAVAALRRGDMPEYWGQSILANQPGADALEYARQWLGGKLPSQPI